MTVTLSLFAGAGAQFLDNNGNLLSGGKIYTYQAGTTTPLTTYTTNSGTIARTNPIVLDAAGRVPSGGEIWLTLGIGYKFVVKTSTEVLIATYDNIPSSAQPPVANDADSIMYEQGYTVTAGNFIIGKMYRIATLGTTDFTLIGAVNNVVGTHFIATGVGTGTGTAELSQTVESKLRETVSVKDFGAVGDGVTDDTVAIQNALTHCIANKSSLFFPAGTYFYEPNATFDLNLNDVPTSLKIFGEGVKLTKLLIDFNGVAFNVNNYWELGPLQLEDMTFELANPSTNNNATGFYFRRVLSSVPRWGASWKITNCDFLKFTNCALHGVEIFNASTIGCNFVGNSFYTASSGLLTTYDDACVRMWGADGTANLQSHSFSNMNIFENCLFGRTKFGFDGWNAYFVEFNNCTFEPNWIGLSSKRVPTAALGINTSTEKGGGPFASVTYDNCWFEQNALYHVSNVDVNNSGVDVNPSILSLLRGANNYSTQTSAQDAKNRPTVTSSGFNTVLLMQGTSLAITDPNYVLAQAFTNNPNETFYQITPTVATWSIPTTFQQITNIGGDWDGAHPVMLNNSGNSYHLWVDISGKLRIKLGAPTSDTDGTVVGTQT